MGDDRRFVQVMDYTRRGHTSPLREGELEIQFGSVVIGMLVVQLVQPV